MKTKLWYTQFYFDCCFHFLTKIEDKAIQALEKKQRNFGVKIYVRSPE